ncbi:MAG: sodium:proton antiporter [Undibacterium sp.]|nr:sodium:proton antiporter [Undibacterium sp.]
MFEVAVICICITAVLAYVNHRWIGLPGAIGVMSIAMTISLSIVGMHQLGFGEISAPAMEFLRGIDFSIVVMNGMLSLLLFAGALHVDISHLRSYKWPILGLSVVGTTLSTMIVGIGTYYIFRAAGVGTSFWYCMVFGALISPTDPVAVLGVLKKYKAPDSLNVVIAGESLFNDGVSVVLFTLLLGIAIKGNVPDATEISWLVVHEVGGGLTLGLTLGAILYYMLRSIDNYSVEVLLTIAVVLGGYLLATKLHVSGPLAMVVTGLLIGNHGRETAMSDKTRHHVDLFWELIDEILNAVLFVLLGLEIILLSLSWKLFWLSVTVISITMFARWLTVGVPIRLTERRMHLPIGAWKVLTWGGLRGGISVALALSLPVGQSRNVILALTYGVVIFSMLVQGLTIGRVIEKSVGRRITGELK